MASDTKALTGHWNLILATWPHGSRMGRPPAHVADAARGGPGPDGSVVSTSLVATVDVRLKASATMPWRWGLARQPIGCAGGTYSGLPSDPAIPLPVARCSALAGNQLCACRSSAR